MGSVQTDIDCPNCKNEAFEDYYYKSDEVYIFCNYCGYHKSATIINRDKPLSELTKDDWKIVEVNNPFASFKLKNTDSLAWTSGTLSTEKEFEELKESVKSIKDSLECFTISRLIDGEIVVFNILKEL
jgi:biotin synthase-related radical SAM superfamily protein